MSTIFLRLQITIISCNWNLKLLFYNLNVTINIILCVENFVKLFDAIIPVQTKSSRTSQQANNKKKLACFILLCVLFNYVHSLIRHDELFQNNALFILNYNFTNKFYILKVTILQNLNFLFLFKVVTHYTLIVDYFFFLSKIHRGWKIPPPNIIW